MHTRNLKQARLRKGIDIESNCIIVITEYLFQQKHVEKLLFLIHVVINYGDVSKNAVYLCDSKVGNNC